MLHWVVRWCWIAMSIAKCQYDLCVVDMIANCVISLIYNMTMIVSRRVFVSSGRAYVCLHLMCVCIITVVDLLLLLIMCFAWLMIIYAVSTCMRSLSSVNVDLSNAYPLRMYRRALMFASVLVKWSVCVYASGFVSCRYVAIIYV